MNMKTTVKYSVTVSCWHCLIKELGTISNAYCENKSNASNLIDLSSDTEYLFVGKFPGYM